MQTHSHKQTIQLVNGIAEDNDNCVLEWGQTFIDSLKVLRISYNPHHPMCFSKGEEVYDYKQWM